MIDYWTIPDLLAEVIGTEFDSRPRDVEFFDGPGVLEAIAATVKQPTWYQREPGYGEGDTFRALRVATVEESAQVYRATAIRLYKEECDNERAIRIGQTVLDAIRAAGIRKP